MVASRLVLLRLVPSRSNCHRRRFRSLIELTASLPSVHHAAASEKARHCCRALVNAQVRPFQNLDATLSRPRRCASERNSRFWSSLKLITRGNAADFSPSTSTVLISTTLASPFLSPEVFFHAIWRSAASTAGQYCSCSRVRLSRFLMLAICALLST